MSEDKAVTAVPMTGRGVALTTMEDAWRFATAIVQSGAAPSMGKGRKMDVATVFAVVQSGMEFGLTPMSALTNMKCVNGRTGPMGKVAKAKVIASGKVKGAIVDEMVGQYGEMDYCCAITSTRKDTGVEITTSFSIGDAKRAGLWGKSGPWTEYPKGQLYYRALGFHLDRVYPDVLMGFDIAESLMDYPDEVEVHGVVLQPLDKPGNDPLLDLLPEGKTADDLEEVFDPGEPEVAVMSHEKRDDILKRLEAADVTVDEADAANAKPEGAEEQPDML
jgi:hypothetical protein